MLEREMGDATAKIIVFLSSKKSCDALTRQLRTDGWPALCIHGDKSQQARLCSNLFESVAEGVAWHCAC